MTAVFKREFRAYFTSMSGYVTAAFLLIFSGIFTMAICLRNGYANYEYVLSNMSFIFMLLVPMLTMRTIAEERRQKTDQLLYSLPVSMTGVVLGKFLAMMAVLAIPTAIMCAYPVILSVFGAVSLKAAFGSVLAFFLMGAALISIGVFVSSMSENQIVSAVLCFVVLLLDYYLSALSAFVSSAAASSYMALAIVMLIVGIIIWLMTRSGVTAMAVTLLGEGAMLILYIVKSSIYAGLFGEIMSALCIFDRFDTFTNGIFDIASIIYFITVTAVFLFLTVQSLEKRRWS